MVRRLASAEGRLLALEGAVKALEVSRSKVPSWAAPAASLGAAIVTSSAAFGGIFAIHWLSVRRQRRDEFFERAQDAVELLNRCAREANRIWHLPGSDGALPASLELLRADVDGLTRRLALLQKTRSEFDLAAEVAAFLDTAMIDIDDPKRLGNPTRADHSVRRGQALQSQILQRYDDVFGDNTKSKRKRAGQQE